MLPATRAWNSLTISRARESNPNSNSNRSSNRSSNRKQPQQPSTAQARTGSVSLRTTKSTINTSNSNAAASRAFAQQAARATLATMMNTNAGAKNAPSGSSGEQPLHCGKWTPEEEAYVQCLIEEFQAGYLPIREGTSLRSFLSKMLNCKPKRISKKFEGSDYNGKQVYVSQPYKLTAEEARERRDRLCTLERKFHQSVAELKNAEGGGGGKPSYEEPLDAAAAAIGGAASLPGGASASARNNMGGMNLSMNPMNMNMNSMNMNAMNMNSMNASGMGVGAMGGQMNQMNSMNRAPSPSVHEPLFSSAAAGQGNASSSSSQQQPLQQQQFLEELAFQDSMLRLRQQQAQQQAAQQQQAQQQAAAQQQAQQQQQSGQGQGNGSNGAAGSAAAGSYVDPILGSLALSQNAVNTTPLAASQYWRRQALLEASTHLDSLRMAQAGAIGIQRPTLEPGGLRDLRMPAHLGGAMPNGGQFADSSSSDNAAAAASLDSSFHKKRRVSDAATNMTLQQQMAMNKDNSMAPGPGGNIAKRMRRDDASSSEELQQQIQHQQQQLANLQGGLGPGAQGFNNQFLR
ncbi:expressed unknown protein [Seminavis robusta]|uniref:Uncharacterized protein n=1 Tax=Seminavis robusta TaxID=568900 RepID=A0A9N8HAQ4_9STRA|nr:expressed unknown protein [Seminavis robusta]|eukprot:Sro233_g094290.1 n/a (573) ;mRNA; f:82285-84003